MNTSKLAGITLIAILVSNCDFLTDDGYDLIIQTDQVRYEADPNVLIRYSIENVGDRTVYYLCGGSSSLEEWVGDELNHVWVLKGQKLCLRVDSIAPGELKTDTLIMGHGRFTHGPDPEMSARVRYRIKESIYKGDEFQVFVDEDDALSNEFEVIRVDG